MNLLTGNIRQLYMKYLIASFGGAILQSVYGLVDMIAVGQYHGADGSAAMAIIAPIWNVVYSLGLLTGIGASIMFNIEKNSEKNDRLKANGFFTVGLIMTSVISIVLWLLLLFYENQILTVFGANDILLPLAKRYLVPVKFALPVFLFMQFMAAFLRNDDAPRLATRAIITGGIFNIIGDVFFVFTLDMGILGAGLATCIGATISLSIMLTHFKSKKNTLKLVIPRSVIKKSEKVVMVGFSTFFLDLAMGILTMLFNIQIMRHLGSDALAVYGVIVNVATFVQCCGYGVGQAAQPILSANYSAGKYTRIKELYKYNVITVSVISAFWVVVSMLFPIGIMNLFMKPSENVLAIAPAIIRIYSASFIFLPFNIYATYYFQSILKEKIAFNISVARGLLISGILIIILPQIFNVNSIWFAMLITECITFVFVMRVINNKSTN